MKFLVGRVASVILTLSVSSVVVFGAMFLAPGDPAVFMLGDRPVTAEALATIRESLGLDRPLPEQYFDWLRHALTGDFGKSILSSENVGDMIASRIPATALLVVMALVIILVFGIVSGAVAATTRSRAVKSALGVLSTAGSATPAFVASILMIAIFGVQLQWFPTFGTGEGFLDEIYHMVLPATALAISYTAVISRVTRSAVDLESGREYVEVARSRGLTRSWTFQHHILRNAWPPILTMAGIVFMVLCVVAVYAERAFQLNGIGFLLIESVVRKDFPVVQAIVMLYVAIFMAVNLLVDVAHVALDPRLRAGKGAR